MRAPRGITLIELLIVMVVLAVLTMIAVPSYRAYTIRAGRADAKAVLLSMAGALERCYTRDNVYNGPSCGPAAQGPTPSPNGYYLGTSMISTDGTQYVLTATPQGSQAADTQCGSFTLDSSNTRGVTGTSSASDCWGR